MDVNCKITLGEGETQELSQILRCNKDELSNFLAPYASAALTEHIMMFLGQKVFTRGSDMLEYRLLLLILNSFNNRVPDEQEVCRLFQTTATGSRSLIRSVLSKYQYQLRTAVNNSMSKIVYAAEQKEPGEDYVVTIQSLNVVDELNGVLAEIDGNLKPISKKRGSITTYEISPASFARLRDYFAQQEKSNE